MHSILSLLLISFSSFFAKDFRVDHALYISVTEIELHENEASKVSIKIFTDDLKAAIQNYSGSGATTSDEVYFNSNTAEITSYLNKYFQLKIENQAIELKYQTFTIEGDACFINLTFTSTKSFSSLSLKAEYLMELFPTQQNVVKINFENEKRFLKFDSSTDAQTINFD